MLAVIESGSKQYKVKVGDKIKVEKIAAEEGESYDFENVLLFSDGKELKVGTPFVTGAKVQAKVLKVAKGKKVTIIKHNAKKRYKKKQGHRQIMAEVEIEKIIA